MTARKFIARIRNAVEWRLYKAREVFVSLEIKLLNELRWLFRNKPSPHGLPFDLIISLTSYPARFPTLALTLKSILTQSTGTEKIILWLGHGDKDKLPECVKKLQNHGLEIWETDDIGCYTKIIPTLHAFPSAGIITVDDDVYYDGNLVKDLVSNYIGSKTIIARRAHEIQFITPGSPKPYLEWRHEVTEKATSENFMPTGVGGVLYPPASFGEEVLDTHTFLKLCPGADDIWLYWMGRRNGNTYHSIGGTRQLLHWGGSQDVGLYQTNLDHGNDIKLTNMINYFGYPGQAREP